MSNFTPADVALLQGAMSQRLVTNQIELGLKAHQALADGALADLQARRIPPMAWSPLAGGHLLAETSQELHRRLHDIGAAHGSDWSAVAWLLAIRRGSSRCWAPTARPASRGFRMRRGS